MEWSVILANEKKLQKGACRVLRRALYWRVVALESPAILPYIPCLSLKYLRSLMRTKHTMTYDSILPVSIALSGRDEIGYKGLKVSREHYLHFLICVCTWQGASSTFPKRCLSRKAVMRYLGLSPVPAGFLIYPQHLYETIAG